MVDKNGNKLCRLFVCIYEQKLENMYVCDGTPLKILAPKFLVVTEIIMKLCRWSRAVYLHSLLSDVLLMYSC